MSVCAGYAGWVHLAIGHLDKAPPKVVHLDAIQIPNATTTANTAAVMIPVNTVYSINDRACFVSQEPAHKFFQILHYLAP